MAVGDDDIADLFKLIEIADDAGVEKLFLVQRRLVDHDLDPFGFDALHDPLDGRGAEVVASCFHDKAIDADGFIVGNWCIGVLVIGYWLVGWLA